MTAASPAGELSDAAFQALRERASADPRSLAALSRTAALNGRAGEAYSLACGARSLAPGDLKVRELTEPAIARGVPEWHFGIVRDSRRNEAYDQAIRRAVGPATQVLDIGAGTGLLAMMAARAGAATVSTCEMNEGVAAAAAAVLEANGYSDRVRLLAMPSAALDADRDLGGRADLLVSEIVSNDLIGEYVLSTVEDAARRLLVPGARMIPSAGELRIALAFWSRLDEKRMGLTAGFDLSAFNTLQRYRHRIRVGDPSLALRGAEAPIFRFDFETGGPFPPEQAELDLAADGGAVNGIAQWIRLQLYDDIIYENHPGSGQASCWACIFYPFREEIWPAAGASIRVRASHDRFHVQIGVAP
jgi:type II protein arginine methyltransferase